MRVSSKTWDGVLAPEDEVGMNGAGRGTKRDKGYLHERVGEGRDQESVGPRA